MEFKKGCFEIRLESIGGLGANLAGKILGEVGAIQLGYNASNFSSYGSEKRGSPVKSFVRYCEKSVPIRANSPVQTPDILGLFHIALAGKEGVMTGVSENTSVVVNTSDEIEKVRDRLKMYAGTLYCIDALKIALDTKSRINMVMMGAISKASGIIEIDKLKETIKDTIGKKYPKALKGNLEAIERGYMEVVCKKFDVDNKYEYEIDREITPKWGYENAPIGGVNPCFGNSITNDLTASREGYVPVFDKEKCINCGLCDSTCPDLAFQFVKGIYKEKEAMVNIGIDYHHCKGCLRCVEICPTNALTEKFEKDVDIKKMHIRNQSLIVDKLKFEDVGASSFITSESNKEDTKI